MHTIFYNAHVLTQDERRPLASAFAVSNGCFSRVGDSGQLLAGLPPDGRSIDLRGLTVVPGFIDAHIHVWKVGNLITHQLDVRGLGSLDELLQALCDFAAHHPDRRWLVARGFNEALWTDRRMPDRHDLDRAVPDRPVVVIRTCAHQLVANTAALQAAGISSATATPAGGEIITDDSGAPNGRLTETAMGLVLNHIDAPSAEDYRHMIAAAQHWLLQHGITSATDPAVMPDVLEVYHALCRHDELKLRLQAIPIRLPDGQQQELPLPQIFDNPYLQVNTVKFFADGAISGRTAALYEPYPGTNNCGQLRLEPSVFLRLAGEAQQAGFRIATHAIGDAAMDLVCNIYAELWERYRRPGNRIEHVGLPADKHLTFMKNAHVFAVMQPIFIYELGKNFRLYLDEARRNRLYPFRSVHDAGVVLALSTDAPVVRSVSPLDNLRAAVTRTDADGYVLGAQETLTAEQALYAYTMGSATANGTDGHNGSITENKWADFVILSGNPLTPGTDVHILATVVGGRIQYVTNRHDVAWLAAQLKAG